MSFVGEHRLHQNVFYVGLDGVGIEPNVVFQHL